MSYQALARKYRPQTFSDIIGQEAVVRTLQHSIEQQRIHHAFLFSGVRGVGKTTSARILAKALNCVHGPTVEPDNVCTICREITEGIDLDVREIDAATYTGVDNIRELRDITQFQPARDRYRIFIIDEAHMLSTGAWNALLKILEEPPPHVVFMFATTEINKVPSTILSRVQKFMLRKITLAELVGRLRQICDSEGITADDAALEIVARRGEGSVRDALSLLDQIIAFSGRSITAVDVATILGLSDSAFFARTVALIGEGNHAAILEALEEASESGRDFKMLYRDLLTFVRNLMLIAGGASTTMLAVSPEDLALIQATAANFSYTDLLRIANLLLRDDETVNRAEHQRLAVELALLKAATFPRLKSVEQLLAGQPAAAQTPPSARPAAARRSEPQEAAPPPRSEAPPRRAAAAASPSSRSSHPGGDLEPFVQRVQKSRPLIGSYLAGAKSSTRNGDRITFLFADDFYAGAVGEAKQELETLAAEVYGERISIDVQTESAQSAPNRRAEDRPSALRDDPVMQSFAKHLGGEVVEPRKR